jgi:hypothetical protein
MENFPHMTVLKAMRGKRRRIEKITGGHKMKREQQMEAMAKADGLEYTEYDGGWWGIRGVTGIVRSKDLPNYFTDNEIDRMVRGLSIIERFTYIGFLAGSTEADRVANTAEQKVEAYLRATNNWSE